MEPTVAVDNLKDELAARNRFESFKLGKGLPSSVIQKKHGHTRSHSRNTSISSSSSLPFSISSKSTNSTDMSSTANLAPPSKRNSHHRRRSSVSTRTESAEMMGVSIPDLPPSTSEDNINLGEKDSIRRRALWALEGKPDLAFSKVEIPELSTPVMEKMMLDFATKPSLAQNTVPSYGSSINTLMTNKRDSFKLLATSSSSKDQLHTLVEEEEEEEEAVKPQELDSKSDHASVPVTPALAITKATPSRPRPANLNLRPLSLTPDNLVSTTSGLPTPSPTPSPRLGLKSLTLAPSSTVDDSTTIMTKRQSSSASKRLSLNLNIVACESPSPMPGSSEDNKSNRRSSICYKSSSSGGVTTNLAGLPTPEMTPTSFERRYSITDSSRRSSTSTNSSGDDDLPGHPMQARPLSASEQHFLFKSHNALLARITDLERALTMRRMSGGASSHGGSRPLSVASDISSSSENTEPSDEMLRLVADLKAERDELKRDVDGWRTRVGDMEKQLSIVAGRVESERRDAWVARSMAGLLEVEKGALERKLAGMDKTVLGLEGEKEVLTKENDEMKKKVTFLEEELEKVKRELSEERSAKETNCMGTELSTTPTPRTPESCPKPTFHATKRGLGFTSVDSESSLTDVEDLSEGNPSFTFPLKSVVEGDEEEEEDGLAGYEDEEDSDLSFCSSSSFGSEEDLPRSVSHLQIDVPAPVTPVLDSCTPATPPASAVQTPRPSHTSRASLSKTWTFPLGARLVTAEKDQDPEIDRFFGCLQDCDTEGSDSVPTSPSAYSYERSKGLFASGFKYGSEDDDIPFFFPLGTGIEEELTKCLDAVPEEDEETQMEDEDDNIFGDVGGIRITFTPPQADDDTSFESQRSPSPLERSSPTMKFFEEDLRDEKPIFNFGRPVTSAPNDIVPVSTPPVTTTPPSSLPRGTSPRISSPSSIPRAVPVKSAFSATDMTMSTPSKSTRVHAPSTPKLTSNAFATPPNKRGGTMPSLIPQPTSSPSPMKSVSTLAKSKAAVSNSTFIRQPQRKPLMSTNNNVRSQDVSSGIAHVNPVMNARSLRRSSNTFRRTSSEMKSIDLSDHFNIHKPISTTPTQTYPYSDHIISSPPPQCLPPAGSSSSFPSIIPSPLASRLSFQTLASFIPISWSQRSSAFGPTTSSSSVETTVNDRHERGFLAPKESAGFPLKRAFVSKEKQLDKLRSRLEREGRINMRTSISVCCKKCDDEAVFL